MIDTDGYLACVTQLAAGRGTKRCRNVGELTRLGSIQRTRRLLEGRQMRSVPSLNGNVSSNGLANADSGSRKLENTSQI